MTSVHAKVFGTPNFSSYAEKTFFGKQKEAYVEFVLMSLSDENKFWIVKTHGADAEKWSSLKHDDKVLVEVNKLGRRSVKVTVRVKSLPMFLSAKQIFLNNLTLREPVT